MMNNNVMVKGETVKLNGKVRGFLYTTVLTDGTVYRYFKPIVRATKTVSNVAPSFLSTYREGRYA